MKKFLGLKHLKISENFFEKYMFDKEKRWQREQGCEGGHIYVYYDLTDIVNSTEIERMLIVYDHREENICPTTDCIHRVFIHNNLYPPYFSADSGAS